MLRSVDVRAIDERTGRAAGEQLGRAGAVGVVDATLVLLATSGDRIVTSDPEDVSRLAAATQLRVAIITC
jgi:hypothetical protein